MTTFKKVVLVEDDRALAGQVLEELRGNGFDVTWFEEGRTLDIEEARTASLMILDLMLPGEHGLDILKRVRGQVDVPVIVLSARNETEDKVRALELGADDYMTKPFWPSELVARVRARLRRPALRREDVVEAGPLQVDLSTRSVRIHGEPLEATLTRVEFDILRCLAERPGTAIARQWLADEVLDPGRHGTTRTLDVHVSRLRKKLGDAQYIRTVWGVGYKLSLAGTEQGTR
jgi:two-component system response regulator MtrA